MVFECTCVGGAFLDFNCVVNYCDWFVRQWIYDNVDLVLLDE
jgi:hypothetical protein